ncbi:MAG: hypothetical protein QE263_05635 [Vampirovibrionales bacterium]|nr:hypothetical protein [Vampirovibrionales bacterium]
MLSAPIPTSEAELATIPNYSAICHRLSVAFRAGAHVDDCHDAVDVDRQVQSVLPATLACNQQLLATISQRLLSNMAELEALARNPESN